MHDLATDERTGRSAMEYTVVTNEQSAGRLNSGTVHQLLANYAPLLLCSKIAPSLNFTRHNRFARECVA